MAQIVTITNEKESVINMGGDNSINIMITQQN